MSTPHIDPIVVREELERQEAHRRVMDNGAKAGKSLLWFDEYGMSAKGAEAVVAVSASLIVSSTPNVKEASDYIEWAARQFTRQILDKAIEKAKQDFYEAEQVRRQKK